MDLLSTVAHCLRSDDGCLILFLSAWVNILTTHVRYGNQSLWLMQLFMNAVEMPGPKNIILHNIWNLDIVKLDSAQLYPFF